MPKPIYMMEPTFQVVETMAPDLGDVSIGQKVRTIINFDVIEKTKSFTVLRIKSISVMPTRREF